MATAAQTEPQPPPAPLDDGWLDGFLAEVRALGIAIGMRETIVANRLLEAARSHGAGHAYARAMFTGLLARSPEDQRKIADAFDRTRGQPTSLQRDGQITRPTDPGPRRPWRQIIGGVLRRIDPAWVAALGAFVLAIALAFSAPGNIPVGQDTTTSPPANQQTVPPTTQHVSPAPPSAFSPDMLMTRIDQQIRNGELSPAPTLAELQRAGWPPREISGGRPLSLPELVVRMGFAQNKPLSLDDPEVAKRIGTSFADLGVEPGIGSRDSVLPAAAAYFSMAVRVFESRGGESLAMVRTDNLAPTAAQPKTTRVHFFRGLIDDLLAPGSLDSAGLSTAQTDDILDRAYLIEVAGEQLPEGAFADASWQPATPSALIKASPLLRPMAFTAPLLLLGLFFVFRSGRGDEDRHPGYRMVSIAGNPLGNRLVAAAPADIRLNRTDRQWMARVARSLNVRQHIAAVVIDAEKSVRGSIQRGGIFTPVASAVTSSPAYVVFVEAKSGLDQEASRLDTLQLRLADAGVPVVRYFYTGSPAMLFAAWGVKPVAIDDVAAMHSDRRLIILGEGHGMLKPFSLRPQAWTSALWQWDDRALLTPRPVSEWGLEEQAITRSLNIPVGRATVEGLLGLAELLRIDGRGGSRPFRTVAFADGIELYPLPALLETQADLYLSEADPDADEPHLPNWIALREELNFYLDTAGMMWLCALALYPALHWDLTLYLGRGLRFGGRELYAEPRLAALTRLPWLREGQLPRWLRRRLIDELPAELKLQALGLIWTILREDKGPAAPWAARLVRPAGRVIPYRARNPAGDPLFRTTVIEQYQLERRSFDKRLVDFGRVHWDKMLAAIVLAGVAWQVAPVPGDGALPPGAYLPLIVLTLLPLLAGLWALRDVLVLRPFGLAAKWARRGWSASRSWLLPSRPPATSADEPSASEALPSRGTDDADLRQPTVFVSCYKPHIRSGQSVQDALRARGFQVVEGTDGEQSRFRLVLDSACMVLVLTVSGLSDQMQVDLKLAREYGKATVIAAVGEPDLSAVSEYGPVFHVGSRDDMIDEREAGRLAAAIRELLGKIPPPNSKEPNSAASTVPASSAIAEASSASASSGPHSSSGTVA